MNYNKRQIEIKKLRKEEKRLFDTYRQHNTDVGKAEHLEVMAKVIRKIIALSK